MRTIPDGLLRSENLNEGEGKSVPTEHHSMVGSSVVEKNLQTRIVDVYTAVVFYESQLPKLVHEIANPASSCTDDFRQSSLRNLGNDFRWPFLIAVPPLTGFGRLSQRQFFLVNNAILQKCSKLNIQPEIKFPKLWQIASELSLSNGLY